MDTYRIHRALVSSSVVDGGSDDAGRSTSAQSVGQSHVGRGTRASGGRAGSTGAERNRHGGADGARNHDAGGNSRGRRADGAVDGGHATVVVAMAGTVEQALAQGMVLGLGRGSQSGDNGHGEVVDEVHFQRRVRDSDSLCLWQANTKRGFKERGAAKSIRR